MHRACQTLHPPGSVRGGKETGSLMPASTATRAGWADPRRGRMTQTWDGNWFAWPRVSLPIGRVAIQNARVAAPSAPAAVRIARLGNEGASVLARILARRSGCSLVHRKFSRRRQDASLTRDDRFPRGPEGSLIAGNACSASRMLALGSGRPPSRRRFPSNEGKCSLGGPECLLRRPEGTLAERECSRRGPDPSIVARNASVGARMLTSRPRLPALQPGTRASSLESLPSRPGLAPAWAGCVFGP